MNATIFEVLTSDYFQDDAVVVAMSEVINGKVKVRNLGDDECRGVTIPVWNLKNINSI